MKKILVLNHFPTIWPPTSGGTLRYFYLYKELSHYFDITLLSQSHEHKGGLFQFSPTFREYKVQKDPQYNELTIDSHSRKSSYEIELIKHFELTKQPSSYRKHFKYFYEKSDLIIHESPYLLNYDVYLGLDQKPRIYNSHNHEYTLASQIWKNEYARKYLPALNKLEKKLVTYADLVFATSEAERDDFISVYRINPKKVKLAPNGIHPKPKVRYKKKKNSRPSAFFIGAEYPPNMEAAEFIIHHLAQKCPDIDFKIAGGCCTPFSNIRKANVTLLGRVPHNQKLRLFNEADIAVNPMFTGAGTNLKTLEFLSEGIPLFSTQHGVRGLNLIHSKHYIHADKEDFADKINRTVRDKKLLKYLSYQGQKYVYAKFSWSHIAKSIREEIQKLSF
ncbi:glycosyltransferase involved in cell wall biosynthesis [Peribacillus deserti]|uniref:Glycosyltransferase involved in cell wall biosynthesis n=1 Tax=Peribacillus deserti TaxID=673318 RepID=A0ABS2QE77_9BACI|nr:glycosyltransferase family 4 protein [Peribacillus deserti]MBM7691477.1 glycosyltransferase involved in cell wall biosynthesis [Peribacillus deserti]